MLNLLKWSLALLLIGCLKAPTPPSPPRAEVSVRIGDEDGHRVDSVKFSTYDTLCFQAVVSDSILATEVKYRWIINEEVYDTLPAYCPPIVKGSIGTAAIILEVEDQEGRIKSDTVHLLANTPPVFDTTRASFIPAEDALLNANSGSGIFFSWAAMDHDDFDTLTYVLRIGTKGKWIDSLFTQSPTGITWKGSLQAGQEYQWQVTVLDWLNDQDSTPIFHFTINDPWEIPYAVTGIVQFPYPGFEQMRSKITLIAESSQGDTLHFALNEKNEFHILLGPQTEPILLYAWNSVTSRSSDTVTVLPNAFGPIVLNDTLEFQ